MSEQPIAPMTEIGSRTEDGIQVTTYSNMDAARQQVLRGQPMFSVPDFVMIGVRYGDGVMLFASSELTQAQLKRETTGFDRIPISDKLGAAVARVPVEKITVTAQMKNFTAVYADDYPSALASLQDLWKNNSASDSGLPAIER